MNKCILTGRITKDPVLESTKRGNYICRFSIATNRIATRDEERKVDFINCAAWNKQAEMLCKYQKKGNLIGVIGEYRTDTYEVNGETKYKTYVLCREIEFLSSKKTNVDKEDIDNLSVKTTTQETTEYTDEDLPW